MTASIATKLKLGDPDTLAVSITDDKALIYRRPAEKKRTMKSSAVDLTAS